MLMKRDVSAGRINKCRNANLLFCWANSDLPEGGINATAGGFSSDVMSCFEKYVRLGTYFFYITMFFAFIQAVWYLR